jgi:YHS domain-containing protein
VTARVLRRKDDLMWSPRTGAREQAATLCVQSTLLTRIDRHSPCVSQSIGYLQNEWRLHMTKDVVCGMVIDENKAAGTVTHQDRTFYFCSASCKVKFVQDPARYADSNPAGNSVPSR